MFGRGNGFLAIAMLLCLIATGFAQESPNGIKEGVCLLADYAKSLMGAIVFALIIMAAIIYAAGQVLGAETRARASVWATAMIVGAVIGIIIFVLLPNILGMMLNQNVGGACG
ncbi:MAG: hypothetical protein NTY83_01370 [Candidatus Micrarchaeota archaeon]|nr:hypothetical protein [Candidatus Micrarchaeota archaeon]